MNMKKIECFWCDTELEHDKGVDVYSCPNGCGDWVPRKEAPWSLEKKKSDYIDDRKKMLYTIATPVKDPLPPVVVRSKKGSSQKCKKRKKPIKKIKTYEIE